MNIDQVKEEVINQTRKLDPKLQEGTSQWLATCVVLIAAVTEFDTWAAIESIADQCFGERAVQRIVNLRMGNALTENGYHDKLQNALAGEDGGLIVAILANVAEGHMVYIPDSDAFSLTNAGKLHVELNLLGGSKGVGSES